MVRTGPYMTASANLSGSCNRSMSLTGPYKAARVKTLLNIYIGNMHNTRIGQNPNRAPRIKAPSNNLSQVITYWFTLERNVEGSGKNARQWGLMGAHVWNDVTVKILEGGGSYSDVVAFSRRSVNYWQMVKITGTLLTEKGKHIYDRGMRLSKSASHFRSFCGQHFKSGVMSSAFGKEMHQSSIGE